MLLMLLSRVLLVVVVRLGGLVLVLYSAPYACILPTTQAYQDYLCSVLVLLLLRLRLSLHACSLLLLDRFQGLSPSGVDKAGLDGRGRVQRMPAASETQRRGEKGRQSSI